MNKKPIKKAVKKDSNLIKDLDIEVVAIADGYYKGVVKKFGQKFKYNGPIVNGSLPLWVEAINQEAAEKAIKQASEALTKANKQNDVKDEKKSSVFGLV